MRPLPLFPCRLRAALPFRVLLALLLLSSLPFLSGAAAAPVPAPRPADVARDGGNDATAVLPAGTGRDTPAGASADRPRIVEPDVTLVLRPGGGRLSSALAEFARDHGWELAWEIERDFPIDHAARFDGPFLEIVAAVVGSLRKTDAPVRAKIYRANKVVRIVHATR